MEQSIFLVDLGEKKDKKNISVSHCLITHMLLMDNYPLANHYKLLLTTTVMLQVVAYP